MKWLRNLWQVHLRGNLVIVGMIAGVLVLFVVAAIHDSLPQAPSATEQELIAIHDLIARQNTMLSVMAATETRILHYAKPHKHPVLLCPECAEQIRKDSQVELTTEGLK